MIKAKVNKYIETLKQYKGAEIDALDRFNELVFETANDGDLKIILRPHLISVHFLGNDDVYLDIYSDNTVACSEDLYGKYMIFKDDIFNKCMLI